MNHKSLIFYILFLLAFASPLPSSATDVIIIKSNKNLSLIKDGANLPSDNEKWYFIIGLGDDHYFGNRITFKNSTGHHFALDLSTLWPFNAHQTMWGFNLHSNKKNSNEGHESLHSSIGVGFYHYLKSNIGDGPFFKTFIGAHKTTIGAKGKKLDKDRFDGPFIRPGMGYALPVMDGTRVQFEMDMKIIKANELSVYAPGLNFNVLF